MFKKLRNKFLYINLAAILSVILVSFIAIFTITYKNIENDVKKQLSTTITRDNKPNDNHGVPGREEIMGKDDLPPTTSFWIEINEQKQILNIHNQGFSNINEATYLSLISEISIDKASGTFSSNGLYWAYQIKQTADGYKVAFIDISNNISTLKSMLFAFLLVAIITAIIVAVLSKLFADRAIKPIQETFDKQKQFVSNASHELKTPLTIINTNIDIVLDNQDQKVEEQVKWLNNIKDESMRMSKLTNDLLYLATLDNAEVKMVFHKFNLSSLLEESILSMEAVAFEKGIQINNTIEKHCFVFGNPEQLRQVFIILIDNAIKYSKDSPNINISLTKKNNTIKLSVTNFGTEISSEHQNKLFDRFYRTDVSRNSQTGGHGLGLAIAKDIIEKHQGSIGIVSKNKETTITVSLQAK